MRERRRSLSKKFRRRKRGYCGGGVLALESTGILPQDADPGGTTLVDACNGFNDMSRLAMLWTVRHHWLEGQGSRSIATGIGRRFSSSSQVMHRSFY